MRIAIGCDHGGFGLKAGLIARLEGLGHQVLDQGCDSADSCDYPDYAAAVARLVAEGQCERGVLICGSGIGMSMVANRFPGVRAALAPSVEHARLGRQHNDANVLCLGERLTPADQAQAILEAFLAQDFESGGRHTRRVTKLEDLPGGRG